MNIRILVLGASGLAGNAIFHQLKNNHYTYGTYFSQDDKYINAENMFNLDIANRESFEKILSITTPQIIVSCLRGRFKEQLYIHNRAAEYISKLSNGKLIYLSTVNVFDKLDMCPHYENDQLSAQSEYGQFKIKCENLITNILDEKAIIIRVPFIWGRFSPRLKKIIEDIQNHNPINLWSNLFTNHTTDIQIAKCINDIINKNMNGVFHIGSDKPCEYNYFIKKLITELQLPMPSLEIEELPYKSYLTVLSSRKDTPIDWKITNSDIIKFLTNNQTT